MTETRYYATTPVDMPPDWVDGRRHDRDDEIFRELDYCRYFHGSVPERLHVNHYDEAGRLIGSEIVSTAEYVPYLDGGDYGSE